MLIDAVLFVLDRIFSGLFRAALQGSLAKRACAAVALVMAIGVAVALALVAFGWALVQVAFKQY